MMADDQLHESEAAELDRMGRALGELLSYEASPAEVEGWIAGTRGRIQADARRRRRIRVTGGLLIAASVAAIVFGLGVLSRIPLPFREGLGEGNEQRVADRAPSASSGGTEVSKHDVAPQTAYVPHPLAWDDRWEDALAGAYADAARLAWETPQVANTADVLRWRVEALEQELAGPSL